ncbi:MAG: Crp/Fnr family transcriptional regulator [bacterium]
MKPMHPAQLPKVPDALRAKLEARGRRQSFSEGAMIYEEGAPCSLVPLLLSGRVRVFKLGESGREITLYRVEPGQLCVLSTSCAVTGEEARLPAMAVAESDGELLALSLPEFQRLLRELPELQAYITGTLTERLSEIMTVVDDVAFGSVNHRLAEYLARSARGNAEGVVEATHAKLAAELGSAREVVSRLLKSFEHKGWVRLGRGRVIVTDPEALEAVSLEDMSLEKSAPALDR